MTVRAVRALVAAAVLLLAGCASADPDVPLGPAPTDPIEPAAQVATLTEVVSEVYTFALEPTDSRAAVTAPGMTVDVAVAELTEAYQLSDGVRDLVAATLIELIRSTETKGEISEVEVTATDPEVVGSRDDMTIAVVDIVVETRTGAGTTTTATTITYALSLDGDRLADVDAWGPGLDSGVGLSSPTGAVERFLAAVRSGDLEAAQYFSDGANTQTELEVLATALNSGVGLTEVPQARDGSMHVVYALDVDGRVLARFEVTVDGDPRVVFSPVY